jgi:hypothetical protein
MKHRNAKNGKGAIRATPASTFSHQSAYCGGHTLEMSEMQLIRFGRINRSSQRNDLSGLSAFAARPLWELQAHPRPPISG